MIRRNEGRSLTIAQGFRPSAELLVRARKVAFKYQVRVRAAGKVWQGSSVELPRVRASANSRSKCVAKTLDALTLSVAYLMHVNARVPRPHWTPALSRRVRLRLTAPEKQLLHSGARCAGFRNASDYIRAIVYSLPIHSDARPSEA